MIAYNQYVPVLAWKKSEQDALGGVFAADAPRVVPLAVIQKPVPKLGPNSLRGTAQACLDNDATSASTCWTGRHIVVDATKLSSFPSVGGITGASYLFSRFAAVHPTFTPLTELWQPFSYQSDVASIAAGRGLALRLSIADIALPNLKMHVDNFLGNTGLSASDVDLVVDLSYLPVVPAATLANITAILSGLPYLPNWRSFVLTSGIFPADLSSFKVGTHHLARGDWTLWRSLIGGAVPRQSSFGDYTTQHALPTMPPPGAVPSASVRYALQDEWLILRGNSLKMARGGKFTQYITHATSLVGSSYFMGASYSDGDNYIYLRTLPKAKTGSAGTWLTAGINHHITLTARQIASLPGF